MRRIVWWGAGAAVLVVGACAHDRVPDKVADADLGRLTTAQMQPVDQARMEQSRAQHALAQAKLGLQEAQLQAQRASADKAAADADLKRAETELKAANDSRAPGTMRQAQTFNDEAALHQREAEAHGIFASKLVEQRQAGVDVAEKRLDAATKREEVAKLEALQKANVPVAAKYDGGKLESDLKNAQVAAAEAQKKAQALGPEVQTARQTWIGLRQQLQARAPGSNLGGPASVGTGTGASSSGTGSGSSGESSTAPSSGSSR